jgi:putative transposase
MTCPHCESTATTKCPDRTELGDRRCRGRDCRRGFHERTGTPFDRLQYSIDVVCLVVLCRFRSKLSLRDPVERFLQRGLVFTHAAVRECRSSAKPCANGVTAWLETAGMSTKPLYVSKASGGSSSEQLGEEQRG